LRTSKKIATIPRIPSTDASASPKQTNGEPSGKSGRTRLVGRFAAATENAASVQQESAVALSAVRAAATSVSHGVRACVVGSAVD
jgi:hypothetical protein